MFPPVDTKNFDAVAIFTRETFSKHFPGQSLAFIDRLLADAHALFTGRNPDYSPVDLRYHDFEHTLQATVCLVQLLEGCLESDVRPSLTSRQFELAIAGVLLHDAGYLKLRSDTAGTGAKYTFCHVLRSCAFAASYLPMLGVTAIEASGVLGAINCTGPTKEISRLHFHDPVEKFIGCALASADYLGQMAASDYPEELEILFTEFSESDDFTNIPHEKRTFKSADDLIARTPDFWRKFVKRKLEVDFQNACRFLAQPYPGGVNPYLAAVERNIAIIEDRVASKLREAI
ncbi:MAG TPA: hypothetical protein VHE13_01635 [Opitutus sp.]|nr:hypothetical protein [Opitutus sp.]